MPYYVVKSKDSEEGVTLVKAPSAAGAMSHAAKKTLTVHKATNDELVSLMSFGFKPEEADTVTRTPRAKKAESKLKSVAQANTEKPPQASDRGLRL